MTNPEFSRRRFLQTSAAIAGVAALSPLGGLAFADTTKRTATDIVTLGKTGIKLSRLGMGTGSDNGRIQQALGKDGFTNLIHYAYDKGITFFDTCDRYLIAPWVGDAIKGLPREKLFIQSKITGYPKDVLAAIDVQRKNCNTDYIDSLMVHSVTMPAWETNDEYKRVLDGFNEAKDKKWITAKGMTCHNLPTLKTAVASDFNEVHQVRVNPQGKYVDGPNPNGHGYVASETFPIDPVLTEIKTMHEKGRGVIGMKIVGNGLFTDAAEREKSIRFALSNPNIDAIVMGFKSSDEIDDAITRINKALAET
jgi:predicted aldo/keto reductase-like oxidoreductase